VRLRGLRYWLLVVSVVLMCGVGWAYYRFFGPGPAMPQYRQSLQVVEGCDPNLWEHTFNRFSLRTLPGGECVRVTGTVRYVYGNHMDGDRCLDIEPEPPYQFLVNDASPNKLIVVEAICQMRPDFWPARPTCDSLVGQPRMPALSVGMRVEVIGRLVTDRWHGGFTEIHPISSIRIIPPRS